MGVSGGGGRSLVALGLACALASHGCGWALAVHWPSETKRQVIDAKRRIQVRGNVPGAVVTSADGTTVLGPAPATIAASYQIERSWEEDSYVGAVIGGLWGLGLFTLGAIKGLTGDETSAPWLAVMAVGAADVLGAVLRIPINVQKNRAARYSPDDRVVPADHSYRVVWEGYDPVPVEITVPDTAAIVAARPTEVSFEQALLLWERHAGTEPTTEALFELGAAHLSRAEAGTPGAAASAVSYFERYLGRATDSGAAPARAERAGRLLERARELSR